MQIFKEGVFLYIYRGACPFPKLAGMSKGAYRCIGFITDAAGGLRVTGAPVKITARGV